MARQLHTALTALGSYATYAANAADLTMTAAIVADKEQVVHPGKIGVFAHNTGASPHTITITSVVDPFNRTGDITAYSLGAGEYAFFGPFELAGWLETDGKLYFESNSNEVKFGVVKLPG